MWPGRSGLLATSFRKSGCEREIADLKSKSFSRFDLSTPIFLTPRSPWTKPSCSSQLTASRKSTAQRSRSWWLALGQASCSGSSRSRNKAVRRGNCESPREVDVRVALESAVDDRLLFHGHEAGEREIQMVSQARILRHSVLKWELENDVLVEGADKTLGRADTEAFFGRQLEGYADLHSLM